MSGQSIRQSWMEVVANVAVGFGISFCGNVFILPLFGVHISPLKSVDVAFAMTGISIARQYVMRRIFNWVQTRQERGPTACHKYPDELCHLTPDCNGFGCHFDGLPNRSFIEGKLYFLGPCQTHAPQENTSPSA